MEKIEVDVHIDNPKISFGLRLALIWAVLFSIIGIIMQSIQTKSLVIINFFGKNYVAWFNIFGNFSNTTLYPNPTDFVFTLLNQWYYFFFTGGLISLVVAIINWLIHLTFKQKEIVIKKEVEIGNSISYQPQTQVAKEAVTEQKNKDKEDLEKIKKETLSEVSSFERKPTISSVTQTKIEEWLEMGLLMLAQGNIVEAELIYEQISRAYDIDRDINHETYKRILDFYYELKEKKK